MEWIVLSFSLFTEIIGWVFIKVKQSHLALKFVRSLIHSHWKILEWFSGIKIKKYENWFRTVKFIDNSPSFELFHDLRIILLEYSFFCRVFIDNSIDRWRHSCSLSIDYFLTSILWVCSYSFYCHCSEMNSLSSIYYFIALN